MGRLLLALRADSENAAAATPATLLLRAGNGPESSGCSESSSARDAENAPAVADPAEQSARLLAAIRFEGLPDALLGCDDSDPTDLASMSAEQLRAYVRALQATGEREGGRQPPGWEHPSQCDGCGPVWLWAAAGERVIACPWCDNRKARRSIPRPLVQCGDCRHFTRDPINPDGGSGDCADKRSPPRPYPHFRRKCGGWRPRE